MKKIVFIIIFTLIFNTYLLSIIIGATESEEKVTEEEVVVTSTRTAENQSKSPGHTEVINAADLQNKETATMAQVLDENGQPVSTYGGASGTANIRLSGGSSEQTLVLINGIPANTGCVGSADLSYFPVAGVKRIEISQGPLSALYGANALGGVVNIITDLTGKPINTVSVMNGDYNTQNLGFGIQRERWGLSFGGSQTDGHRIRSKTNNSYLLGQYDFIQGKEEYLSLYWQYLNKENQVPGSESWLLNEANQTEQNSSLNLNGKNSWLGGQWEYKIYSQSLDLKYDNADPFSPEHDQHQTANYGLDLAGLYELGDHALLSGIMFRQDSFNSTISGKHDQSNNGLFIQDNWKMSDGVKLVSGLRWDHCSNYPAPVSPRLALIKSLSENVTVKIGYGKAFRAPTIHDLYWNQPAYGMYGNPDLKPEEGERYEVSGEWRQGSQTVTINFFQSNLTNGIRWDDPEGDYTYTVVNIDKLQTNGAGITWESIWGEIFSCRVGYQWLDEKAWDKTTGIYSLDKNFFGTDQFNLGLGVKNGPWQTGLDWKLVQNRMNQGTTVMPNCQTGNFNLGYQMNNQIKIILAVDNVTNERYAIYKGYPLPGRETKLGFNYRF